MTTTARECEFLAWLEYARLHPYCGRPDVHALATMDVQLDADLLHVVGHLAKEWGVDRQRAIEWLLRIAIHDCCVTCQPQSRELVR